MKLLIVDDQSTVVQGLLHCTNWAAMGFTVVDTALNGRRPRSCSAILKCPWKAGWICWTDSGSEG